MSSERVLHVSIGRLSYVCSAQVHVSPALWRGSAPFEALTLSQDDRTEARSLQTGAGTP